MGITCRNGPDARCQSTSPLLLVSPVLAQETGKEKRAPGLGRPLAEVQD